MKYETPGKLRSDFNRQGRAYSGQHLDTMSQSSGHPNGPNDSERTPLISSGTGNQGGMNALHFPHNAQGEPLYEDDRAWVRYPMRFIRLTWLTLASNYVNVLLVFVPVGIILGALDMDPVAVFVVNFLAIMPLAALLSFATEELSAKLGQTIGGLMNATFGNAVELIVRFSEFNEEDYIY